MTINHQRKKDSLDSLLPLEKSLNKRERSKHVDRTNFAEQRPNMHSERQQGRKSK
jgi:hypothetical protein